MANLPPRFQLSHSGRNKYRKVKDFRSDDLPWADKAEVALANVREAYDNANGATVGSVQCNACETGFLIWTLTPDGSKLHASCTTPGCQQWIEG